MSSSVASGAASRSLFEVSKKTRALYRDCLRNVVNICKIYGLDVPPKDVQSAMRRQFVKHKDVKNLEILDMLLFKGKLELEETKALFKTKTHVMRYFEKPEPALDEQNYIFSQRLQKKVFIPPFSKPIRDALASKD